MPQVTSLGELGNQVNPGPAMQALVPASVHGLVATIPASSSIISNLIFSDGYQIGAVGVTSSQAGAITVQRYLDNAATIPQGAALTASLTANTAQVLNITDGYAFASFTVTISNTSGSTTANLTKLGILLQGK